VLNTDTSNIVPSTGVASTNFAAAVAVSTEKEVDDKLM